MILTQDTSASANVLNLNDIISDLKKSPDFKEIKAGHPDVKVVFDLEMPLEHIKGVPTLIRGAVVKIIRNAVESISGQGRVTVSTANRHIEAPEKCYRHMIEKEIMLL
jgi:signal transduction histidine kinase